MISINFLLPTGLDEKFKTFLKGGDGHDTVLRTVATSMLGVVKYRIHNEGIDASGNQIGTYSKEYMVVRTNSFQNNLKTKGENKGKGRTTSAGQFTKGKSKGQARPIYNRNYDPKVVISLTRQMENDFVVIATDNGYGLGYNNPDNRKKVDYVEATYNKSIFSLTDTELGQSNEVAKQTTAEVLNRMK